MKTFEDAVRDRGGVWPKRALSKGSIGVMLWLDSDGCIKTCTRTEFEECTRRLRNEPSWDDAPGWAVAKAQDSDGEWYWFSAKPMTGPECWVRQLIGRHRLAVKGEVIGDWRDTLRLRPQEKKMEDKNDWHKRGEFPPVGTVCKLRFATAAEIVVTITYVGDGVMCYRNEKGMEYTAASNEVKLRPLQTERERWIKAAQLAIDLPLSHAKMLGEIYDAGLAKMPEDDQ